MSNVGGSLDTATSEEKSRRYSQGAQALNGIIDSSVLSRRCYSQWALNGNGMEGLASTAHLTGVDLNY
jgi:hypothetical protein